MNRITIRFDNDNCFGEFQKEDGIFRGVFQSFENNKQRILIFQERGIEHGFNITFIYEKNKR